MTFYGVLFAIILLSVSVFGQGRISGTVTMNQDVPIHGVQVLIVQSKQSTRTDENGNYELNDVPQGRHTILVHLDGFADATRIVNVAAGSVLNENFRLELLSLREQVTVTASGTEQSVFDSFQSVNTVGTTAIIERAATSIGEVLEHEPGVAKRSFGPGSARPIIRGFDGDRVLVMQDGVRTGSLGSQSGDHGETVDPLNAERIEILKGPATLLYGSNAIGGVVNAIGHHDNHAHDGFRGYFTGVGSTADKQIGASGGLEYGINNWLFRGNFGSQKTGDFKTPIGEIHNSATRANNFSLGTGYYGDKAFFGVTYGYDKRRFGIPFAGEFHHHHEEDEEKGGTFDEDHDEEIDVDLRSVRHNVRFNGGFRNLTNSFISGVTFSVDHTKYRHEEIEIEDGIDEVGTLFKNRTFSFRSVFEQQKYKTLTGRFGFEGFDREYEVTGEEQLIRGPVKQNSFSVFALEEVNLDRVKFQFGGRVENNRYRPADLLLPSRDFTAFSGGAGINVGLWKGGAFVFNYNHSSRAPALEELYNFGPHIGNLTFEIGNPDLRMERSNGVDFSLRHSSDRIRLTGDVYYYRIKNFVYLAYQDEDSDGEIDLEDGLPVGVYDQSDARYVGVELSGDVRFNDYAGAYFGFDAVRAELVDEGLNVPRIPPARLRLGLDLRWQGLSVRPETIFAGRQDKVYPLETPTAGYGIFNVAASYTIGRQHQAHIFSVNAYNLTNKLYRNHVSFIKDLMPEIGRGIRFGYTIRFF
ncbi:MAG TPA: TonB-dependent receptor [Pyrinomonadaceae bacterium]|nr:TonB-dependent receptor [Pyrinomonadaceae bacterium]